MVPQHALVISTRSVDASSEKRVEPSEVKGRDKDTIFYWNPAVKLEKEFSISFDMPSSHSNYRVVLEGILEDGRIVCQQREKMPRSRVELMITGGDMLRGQPICFE